MPKLTSGPITMENKNKSYNVRFEICEISPAISYSVL